MRPTALILVAFFAAQPVLADPAGPGQSCRHESAGGPAVVAAAARANLASYISNDDYPATALRNAEEGVVGFRLSIAPTGRVSECEIVSSSGSPSLDSTTCRLMRSRASFTPASDAQGRQVPDEVDSKIMWRLPVKRDPLPSG